MVTSVIGNAFPREFSRMTRLASVSYTHLIKYVEVPAKKITEIRIFIDNGTYETFKPEN